MARLEDWEVGYYAPYAVRRRKRNIEAMLLRLEGLKYREIGKRMGITVNAAREADLKGRMALARAMRRTKLYLIDQP